MADETHLDYTPNADKPECIPATLISQLSLEGECKWPLTTILDANGNECTTLDLSRLPRPKRKAQPNSIGYVDGEGVRREKYIPQGQMALAWEHLENERWEALGAFEDYTDQGYSESDYKPNRQDGRL
ncbi:hypothetical protein BDY17DRAFT_325461 [Neohortaea acidophila]|uniref:Uncharacterized protein n=1 Tax=Neohortaea acidophila TaxID=245834 RepID=A0A6A6PPE3_9PEZI|nr:uncharacterized protein BDY17DRAFT_325461 [Neohortaea acidophila]KAF2481958.1 hypothetical protein BDY17DRAFT_325461 [Neohortaea acidophila]